VGVYDLGRVRDREGILPAGEVNAIFISNREKRKEYKEVWILFYFVLAITIVFAKN